MTLPMLMTLMMLSVCALMMSMMIIRFCSVGTFSLQGLHKLQLCLHPPDLVLTYRVSPLPAFVLRSVGLSFPCVPSLDDRLLPEGPARLPG